MNEISKREQLPMVVNAFDGETYTIYEDNGKAFIYRGDMSKMDMGRVKLMTSQFGWFFSIISLLLVVAGATTIGITGSFLPALMFIPAAVIGGNIFQSAKAANRTLAIDPKTKSLMINPNTAKAVLPAVWDDKKKFDVGVFTAASKVVALAEQIGGDISEETSRAVADLLLEVSSLDNDDNKATRAYIEVTSKLLRLEAPLNKILAEMKRSREIELVGLNKNKINETVLENTDNLLDRLNMEASLSAEVNDSMEEKFGFTENSIQLQIRHGF